MAHDTAGVRPYLDKSGRYCDPFPDPPQIDQLTLAQLRAFRDVGVEAGVLKGGADKAMDSLIKRRASLDGKPREYLEDLLRRCWSNDPGLWLEEKPDG